MSDPLQRLSPDDVQAAGLDDWRLVLDRLRARFATGDFATGLALVDRIGAAAEEADHHPDVTLTYPEVRVELVSHDVGGVTSRDVELARAISGLAREAGLTARPADQTVVELGLDTGDPTRVGPFYAALLGGEAQGHAVTDASGQATPLWFQTPPTPQEAEAGLLPPAEPAQRWHLDVWVPVEAGPARVQAVVEAGGRLVSDAEAPSFWVLEDADGNRSCVCTHADRS